ncbi:Metallo-dependent phosphatase-like protein [Mycotypha africana]|uniref:Metallo-dependent phosphatase-like protein n=1 Tax=Mycotypha africana TaxID=64632 RepID=UPI0022FFD6C7|nr:Metallo-dependent phosphatase-like protein [Mycotypha africana]KAI8981804.1 Metallo-dependent phosphatase-like protein [Mycotypha africana]
MMHKILLLVLSITASALLLWQNYDLLKKEKRILMHDRVTHFLGSSSSTTRVGNNDNVDGLTASNPSKKYGYFLQITDIHMDDHYTTGATLESGCHTLPKKHSRHHKLCNAMGEPGKRMDAPPIVVEHTLDWIRRHWKDKLDFVIWTGDNSRHDWDAQLPRQKHKVLALNRIVTNLMAQLFDDKDATNTSIPVVPVIGNNDVQPHNGIEKNDDILRSFEKMWSRWIPGDQRQDFLQGGYFAVDVIPEKLRVLAMNTMFFIKKNPAARTCSKKHSVGYMHMRWYKRQLAKARQDQMKVYVIGHVPPSTRDFFKNCMRDYLAITSEYSDVVMGHFYGHLNMDHFLLYDKRQQEEEMDYFNDDEGEENEDGDAASDISIIKESNVPADDSLTLQRSPKHYVKWLKAMYKKVVDYEEEHPFDEQHRRKNVYESDMKTQRLFSAKTTKNLTLNNNNPITLIYVAPSVFPIYMPSLRIYRYEIDHTTNNGANYGRLLGYTQFVANITRYNQQGSHKYPVIPLEFDLEYDTKDLYSMKELSTKTYLELAKNFTQQEDKTLWDVYCNNIFLQTKTHVC